MIWPKREGGSSHEEVEIQPEAPKNHTGLGEAKTVELFNQQAGEVDPLKRRRIVKELELDTLQLYGYSFNYHTIAILAWDAKVRNWTPFVSEPNNGQYRDVWLDQ